MNFKISLQCMTLIHTLLLSIVFKACFENLHPVTWYSSAYQVNFTDETHQPFFFTEDGQSDRGLHFYNITYVDGPNSPFRYMDVSGPGVED